MKCKSLIFQYITFFAVCKCFLEIFPKKAKRIAPSRHKRKDGAIQLDKTPPQDLERGLKLLQTLTANALSAKIYHVGGIAAKDAGGKILFENDTVSVRKNLYRILYVEIHHLSKLDGKNDSSKLVHLAYYTG